MIKDNQIKWNIYKNGYVSGEVIKVYAYFHSIITAGCFTYFIGLFSAGPQNVASNKILFATTLFFAISLLLNSLLSLCYYFLKDNREIIFEFHTYSKICGMVISASYLLPIISFILFVIYYSYFIGIFIIILALFLYFLFSCSKKEVDEIKRMHDVECKKMMEEGRRHDWYEYKQKIDFPILSLEKKEKLLLEFCINRKLSKILNSFSLDLKKSYSSFHQTYETKLVDLLDSVVILSSINYKTSKEIQCLINKIDRLDKDNQDNQDNIDNVLLDIKKLIEKVEEWRYI